MIKKLLVMAIIIFIICCLLLIISLCQINFRITSGILVHENTIEELKYMDFYQGFLIEIEGFLKPKIDSITIIKKNGEGFADSERLLIDIYDHTGRISTEELKENRDNYILAENFIPAYKVFNLAIKNDSYLHLHEIGELRIYYSLLGIKMHKRLALDYIEN